MISHYWVLQLRVDVITMAIFNLASAILESWLPLNHKNITFSKWYRISCLSLLYLLWSFWLSLYPSSLIIKFIEEVLFEKLLSDVFFSEIFLIGLPIKEPNSYLFVFLFYFLSCLCLITLPHISLFHVPVPLLIDIYISIIPCNIEFI